MKKPNPPKLVTIAVTTTITVVFWIFFTLYQVLTTSPNPSVNQELLDPIVPELDSASLQKIKERVYFEEGSFIFDSQVDIQSSRPTLSPTPIQEEDTGQELSATTESGTIDQGSNVQ